MNILTIDELEKIYLTTAQANMNDIDISNLTDIQIKAKAVAGIGAGVALDAYRLFNASYPQNADNFGVNTQLSARGVPSQFPASPAQITVKVNILSANLSYKVNVGQLLVSDNNIIYSVVQSNPDLDYVVIDKNFPFLFLLSKNTGSNNSQKNGAVLKFIPSIVPMDKSNNPISEAIVTESIDGTDEESITHAVNRLIEVIQSPLCSSRAIDIKYLAIDPKIGVNDAIVLTNNELEYIDRDITVGVYDVGGSPISNETLNKGLLSGSNAVVFKRNINQATIDTTKKKIVAQNIIGVFPEVNTVETQALTKITNPDTPFLKITVQLQFGYTLSTNIQLDDGTFTIKQLIQREVRRAVCGQPFGASLEIDLSNGSIISSSLPISAIEQALDEALGTPTTIGTVGQYLTNRSVLVYDKVNRGYGYVATIPLSTGIPVNNNDPISWIYDISLDPNHIYSNIGVF